MAGAATYCTHRDVEDVFPNINDYDSKEAVYGWETTGTSNLYLARNPGLVTQLFVDGENLGDPEANSGVLDVNGEWYYDSTIDTVYYFNSAASPADLLMEAGEDFATLMTRVMANASRFFDSRVDSTVSRDQWKDREGNYDYMIVRTVSLLTVAFMIKSYDPMNVMLGKFEEEVDINIALINGGQAKLSHQNTADSAKGSIREVGTISGAVRPVDTRGSWGGTYDLIKVKIIAGGAIDGTATYSVWVKDGDKLGVNEGTQVVTAEKINGDYQALAGGLQIRFAGSAKDSTATADDEWEVEVWGRGEAVDNPVVRSVKMTRGWKTNRLGY